MVCQEQRGPAPRRSGSTRDPGRPGREPASCDVDPARQKVDPARQKLQEERRAEPDEPVELAER